jgi:alkylation response protein AidB-like acyl-CoA dehydrogenase
MNFLSEEQQAWKESVRRWVDRDVGRVHPQMRHGQGLSVRGLRESRQARLSQPARHGGYGGDVVAYALMCEALSCYGVGFSVAIAGGIFTAMNLSLHGTEDPKQRFLKPFMRDDPEALAGLAQHVRGRHTVGGGTSQIQRTIIAQEMRV